MNAVTVFTLDLSLKRSDFCQWDIYKSSTFSKYHKINQNLVLINLFDIFLGLSIIRIELFAWFRICPHVIKFIGTVIAITTFFTFTWIICFVLFLCFLLLFLMLQLDFFGLLFAFLKSSNAFFPVLIGNIFGNFLPLLLGVFHIFKLYNRLLKKHLLLLTPIRGFIFDEFRRFYNLGLSFFRLLFFVMMMVVMVMLFLRFFLLLCLSCFHFLLLFLKLLYSSFFNFCLFFEFFNLCKDLIKVVVHIFQGFKDIFDLEIIIKQHLLKLPFKWISDALIEKHKACIAFWIIIRNNYF